MKNRSLLLIMLTVLILILSGCGGPKFEGHWLLEHKNIMTGAPNVHELIIEVRNGKHFINETIYSYEMNLAANNNYTCRLTKKKALNNLTGTLNDIKLAIDGSEGAPVLTYLDGDDTINFMGKMYHRIDGNDFTPYIVKLQERVKEYLHNPPENIPANNLPYGPPVIVIPLEVGEIIFTE